MRLKISERVSDLFKKIFKGSYCSNSSVKFSKNNCFGKIREILILDEHIEVSGFGLQQYKKTTKIFFYIFSEFIHSNVYFESAI